MTKDAPILTRMPWYLAFVLPDWVRAITIPPVGMYARRGYEFDPRTRVHESAHWAQYQRLGLVRFYLTYWYYLARYGYNNHPMERDARQQAGEV